MEIKCLTYKQVKEKKNEARVIAILEGQKEIKNFKEFLSDHLLSRVEKFVSRGSVSLKKHDMYSFDVFETDPFQMLYIIVLGKELFLEGVRQACGRLLDYVEVQGHRNFQIDTGSFQIKGVTLSECVEAMAEGVYLSSYRFDRFKSSEKKIRTNLCEFLFKKEEDLHCSKNIEVAHIICESVHFTRDLVNAPSNEMPPRILAEKASQMAKESKIACKIYDKKELQKMKMGGILAVSQGSVEEPRMIVLEYGDPKTPVDFAFVGKGVTFDSGGISIKPSDGMEKMKYDMAGGATVIGILRAVAKLRLNLHVVGIIPSAENMPSGAAYRPGDVIWMGSGKSVEVLNTDAEGRLLLGDGLFLAQSFSPKRVIDLATLTGACMVALGTQAIGLMGNDSKVIEKIKEAGEASGERVWELPLWDDYFDQIKSDVAEIKNVGGKGAGTITAAMFLKQFVKYPWAHLDIAGTAWADEKKPYCPKGATGIGLRLLVKMMRDTTKV
ncbi:MAG: leucyl aminopeptidase [Chlamydiae bacterium]|nr:leucyl aminopeptidase [Chlamydiota bacterium]